MTREHLMGLAEALDEVADYATRTGEGALGLALTEAAGVLSELAIREALNDEFFTPGPGQ
ncbi:MAG TPA: hypothetical protein VMU63_10515 [Acidimicrobiales bacterium]|nr:hypothetical protein [Acidimicrobiales bacterium]